MKRNLPIIILAIIAIAALAGFFIELHQKSTVSSSRDELQSEVYTLKGQLQAAQATPTPTPTPVATPTPTPTSSSKTTPTPKVTVTPLVKTKP